MLDQTQRIYPIASDWQPCDLHISSDSCLALLAQRDIAIPDVRDVVHTWLTHWGFTGRDYREMMRPYISGDWRKYDGLSSPLWRGKAKDTGRELFDCELSEQVLAYHPVAIAHDDDFAHQRGFLRSNRKFRRRAGKCEFGRLRAWAMWTAVSTFGYPIYRRHGRGA